MAFPRTPRGLGLAGDIAAMLALLAVTIWVTAADTRRWPASRRWLVLLAQMLLTYMPVGISGSLFSGCAACLAGSALLLLPLWAGAALFAAVIASMLLTAQALVASAYETAVCLLTTLVFGLVVFVLPRLAWFIGSAREGWRDAATFAVINERMRFARDLHDLLGYSLSAIAVKAEFASQVAATEPDRARDELSEVLAIARLALTDMRTVADGFHRLSLSREVNSAASLLAAADIDVRAEIDCGTLDELLDTAFATVLRELVTNVLRHSRARHCVITGSTDCGSVTLRVANDGVACSASAPSRGNGLRNLTNRMAALGGTLSIRSGRDGWFEVLAQAPLASEETAQHSAGRDHYAQTLDNVIADSLSLGNREGLTGS
jgi:two-component system sensor histidine kinase DesK